MPTYLTDLATAVRKSGLPVVEVDGWETRGHGPMQAVEAVVCHHTATAASAAGDYPSLRIVRDGRSDLPGPLCNLGLGRNGTVYVIAAGYGYHAGSVRSSWMANDHSIGIEAEATGLDPWPPAQIDAYARLCAALCEHYDLPVARVLGHKEVCSPVGRKTDPNFDMAAFRAAVTNVEDDMPSPKDWTPEDWAAVQKNLSKPLVEQVWAAVVDGGKLTALNVVGRLGKAFDRNGKPRA